MRSTRPGRRRARSSPIEPGTGARHTPGHLGGSRASFDQEPVIPPAAAARAQAPYSILFGGIFAVAFATLLIELSLIRVFSFTIWHHFGYVVISTALLGFGASGTLLAVRPQLGTQDLRRTLAGCTALAGATSLGALLFVAAVPLHPMSILEDATQLVLLFTYQIVVAVPFFFSGLVVSLCLRTGAERVDRLYFWDLLGAGLGCVAAVQLMNWLTPPGSAIFASASFMVAAGAFATDRRSRVAAAGVALLLVVATSFAERIPFTAARSKQYAIQISGLGMKPVFTSWTSLFRTDIVEDVAPKPGRGARWGVSRRAPANTEQPKRYINHDATAGAGIYDLSDAYTVDEIEYSIFKAPYVVANPKPRVLVIGVGGGRDLVVADQFGASTITGVELDPVAVDLLREGMDELTNGFFRRPHVRLVAAEGRSFIRSAGEEYDVIQLTGVDTLSALNSGAYVLAENYLYTVEAFHDYLDHLAPGGILSFAMGNLDPDEPRAAGRIVSVARQALLERGIERPEAHIAVVDSRTLYAEVMIRTTPFEDEHAVKLIQFARPLGFRPLWIPGRGGHPKFRALATASGPDRERFLASLRYKISATTDSNPFFLSFFRWSDLLEPGKLTPSHSSALTQIVLLALLFFLTALGGVFILLPLWVFGRRARGGRLAERVGVMVFFLSLGLGFMLFEISLIQHFVLFLGYPTYSLSVTLGSLLVFLGCGSYLSRRWVGRERVVLPCAVVAIAALALFYVVLLPPLQAYFLGSPVFVRVIVTIAVLAPLGLVMGLFFPLGIRIAAGLHEDMVPWAWAINGCASVTAGVLAVVLAMTFGFYVVWSLSVLIYALGVIGLLAGLRSSPVLSGASAR